MTQTMTQTPTPTRPATAAETLLLAAGGLGEEWTEWELTVAAWKLDRQRFGMKGFPHPDHKRVYCELIKQRFPWAKRVRPSTWTLTKKGRTALKRLRSGLRMGAPAGEATKALIRALNHSAYLLWLADPALPDRVEHWLNFLHTVNATHDMLAEAIDDLEPEDKPAFAGLSDFLTAMAYRFGEVA
jgi:hypothetical protein